MYKSIFLIILISLFWNGEIFSKESKKIKIVEYLWSQSDTFDKNLGNHPDWQKMELNVLAPPGNREKILWQRFKLEDISRFKNPVLYLPSIDQIFSAYLRGEEVYSFGDFSRSDWDPGYQFHLIPVPIDANDEYIYFKIISQHSSIGIMGKPIFLEANEHFIYILSGEMNRVIASLFFVFLGILMIPFAIVRWRNLSHFAFVSLCITAGFWTFSELKSKQLLYENGRFWMHFNLYSVYVFPLFFTMFIDKAIGSGYKKFMTRLWQVHLVFVIITVVTVSFQMIPIRQFLSMNYGIIFLLVLVNMVYLIYKVMHKDFYSRFVFLGFFLLALFGIHDMFLHIGIFPYSTTVMDFGFLGFLISLGSILIHQFLKTYEEKKLLNDQLNRMTLSALEMTRSSNAMDITVLAIHNMFRSYLLPYFDEIYIYYNKVDKKVYEKYCVYREETFFDVPMQLITDESPGIIPDNYDYNIDKKGITIPVHFNDKLFSYIYVTLKQKSKRTHRFELIAGYIKQEKYLIDGIRGSLGIILENKEVEKDKKLSLVGSMAARIVHDLRNPLYIIQGFIELSKENALSDEQRIQYLDKAEIQTKKNIRMLQDILDYSKGTFSIHTESISLTELIDEVIGDMEMMPSTIFVTIRFQPEEDFIIHADRELLSRVILNILINAVEAMENKSIQNPSIRIDIARKDNSITLAIEDNGPGIHADIELSVFEAFVTSGKSNGTGLGLFIAKSILEKHHASISYSRGKILGGAMFTIQFGSD
ncbi:MAG: HAMP domain-containing histidine kinase [Leptospira sp.]|nr:HAMP domain-containing histidine kinase [Leptospira sp.]